MEAVAGRRGNGMTEALAHASPSPLYRQLKRILRDHILDGRYAPHERLPSEHELVRAYGISRVTARQALGELEREGLVFRVQGKGSFVAKPPVVHRMTSLKGFAEEMSSQGFESISRVLKTEPVRASSTVAQRLGLQEGDPVFEIHRVRLVNREPVSLDVSFFPLEVGRRLVREDLVTRDIFWLLENACGLPLGAAECQFGTAAADTDMAASLGIWEGAPLLSIERLTHGGDGRPLDYEHLYIRSDRFRYTLSLERKRN